MSLAFESIAVDAVAAIMADPTIGFVAQLRVIETEDGLPANSLPDPVAIVRALVPGDYRSPLLQVYDEDARPMYAGHRHDLATAEITLGISYNSDADVEAAEVLMRRYLRAARMVLKASPTCGGRVSQTYWNESGRTLELTYDSATRHGRLLGITVRVHDP